MAQPGQPPAAFVVGEKVYCPYMDKYYEAKILEAEYRQDTGWWYFVHYSGWNKKYDEFRQEHEVKKPQEAEATGVAVTTFGGKTRKAGTVPIKKKSSGHKEPQGATVTLDVDLPPLLKKVLINDYECVVEENKFVPLPRTPCIADFLEQYVQEAKEIRTGTVDAEEEVAHGLQSYFDKALLAVLLYRQERGQAGHALADGRAPSSVYGAEHFVRLLYKLPELMPLHAMTDDQLSTIATMVQDVVLWIVDNHQQLFLTKEQYQAAANTMQLLPRI